ncbi:type II toxin-antitoxin system CcdA family antitoxin [Pseudorhizobium flavum]|jgi:antitoxin CcdA|uniref:Antitoxin CcdA n=1 Tax=Pseudorhizobium flavum TaxID=1335061 RepID=A0A7W9YVM5_9HYPH|nr:type II toxin-antitoxin system CcdA family antitoxin [Pseudorhizobium flavum]MBB6179107.1 antitoxin CcdA [Pseudorhizobium flavum]CAD6603407.1 post-segregation antitoxin (ccd killing mechanism protein) encoded by the F plasmid [Pseudorhizobium flavum]
MAASRTLARLPLNGALLSEAQALKVDLSEAAEDGIARAVKAEKERLWKIENAEAIRIENEYVEKHGLPLGRFRQF